MNVLIVGSGGREYAIALGLLKDKNIKKLFFAPGNGATSNLGENINISDYEELSLFAKENVSFTIVGPEEPLANGICDIFRQKNLKIFGPSKNAAKLEASKVFMKDFLNKYNIKTAKYIQTNSFEKASDFIQTLNLPIVIKADGLCAGKGVIIAKSKDEARKVAKDMLSGKSFADAGKSIVIEEFLDGYELSLFAICDGEDFVLLPACQDHKKLLDMDKGPNTGGMGAYAPTPFANEDFYKKVSSDIIKPTLLGMREENALFEGVLFVGLMVVKEEIYVLEYNVRFGDPECEVLIPLIKNPISELFLKTINHDLKNFTINLENKFALCVVIASENYPYKSSEKQEITITKEIKNTHVVFAGVSKQNDKLYSSGGRVLLSVAVANSLSEAKNLAYLQIKNIHFNAMQYRKDIGYQAS